MTCRRRVGLYLGLEAVTDSKSNSTSNYVLTR
ncbi:unnamed protein product [Spodoptera exigua]|nr:unnamed protein product [Spodoptera exigua]